jgi:uncharacterized protein YpmS
MAEPGGDVKFWKRTCMFLATLLALAVVTICALVVVVTGSSTAHRLELNAVRAQGEKDRDILIKMWQASDNALTREREKATASARSSKSQ